MRPTVDRERLQQLTAREKAFFVDHHPRSRLLWERAKEHMLDGVPMNWMTRWASPYPVFVAEAHGAHFIDADGLEYVDLCLGDTGAMTGHSPKAAVDAIAGQAAKGITTMLPTEESLWVAEELSHRFGLKYWQVAMTATDANRFALRLARHVTRRPKVLVFNWCYHGSVDEAIITINDGVAGPKPGSVGPAVDPASTTKVIEFNDVEALEQELAAHDVAAVLAEPALTNIGIVLPQAGFHEALRRITQEHGTALIIDETHTLCAGPGGCTAAWDLSPDMITLGKPLGSGIPCAVYGFGDLIADGIHANWDYHAADVCGVGGTLSGNALQIAAMHATLDSVLTPEAFELTSRLAERWSDGVRGVIDEFALPWVVVRLGSRAEYWPRSVPPLNGGEAAAAEDPELDEYLHLFALNRGILMTPFHNMALMSPATTTEDVDRHTEVFRQAASTLRQ